MEFVTLETEHKHSGKKKKNRWQAPKMLNFKDPRKTQSTSLTIIKITEAMDVLLDLQELNQANGSSVN